MTNQELQHKLNFVLDLDLKVDGIIGRKTKQAIRLFQQHYGLKNDGIVGKQTRQVLSLAYRNKSLKRNLLNFSPKPRFVVFVDAGHGGINDRLEYTTAGKRARHEGLALHDGPNYYEGFENRIIAEMFIEKLTAKGILSIRTYHPFVDTSLTYRASLIKSWLTRGYYGYLHSFHSNAISKSNSKEKLENTRGFITFNTKGDNFSDQISTKQFQLAQNAFADQWIIRSQDRKDGDPDFEANFKILRETDLDKFGDKFGAILEEFGFHTSSKDTFFITRPETRRKRVEVALKTALWVRDRQNNNH